MTQFVGRLKDCLEKQTLRFATLTLALSLLLKEGRLTRCASQSKPERGQVTGRLKDYYYPNMLSQSNDKEPA